MRWCPDPGPVRRHAEPAKAQSAYPPVSVIRKHAHHVRVMTVQPMVNSQESKDETDDITLWSVGAQQHSSKGGHSFEHVCWDYHQVVGQRPDVTLDGFNLGEIGQLALAGHGDV